MNKKALNICVSILLLLSLVLMSGCSSAYGGIFDRKEHSIKKDDQAPAPQSDQAGAETDSVYSGPDLKLESRYTWQYMNESERELYRELAETLAQKESVSGYIDADEDTIHRIVKYICCDFPEFFWFSGEYTIYTRTIGNKVLNTYIEFNYTVDDIDSAEAVVRSVSDEIIAGIDPSAGDYEKVKYVFDYIINSTDYDTSLSSEQSMYSVLVDGRGVCAGYSKAAQYLLNQLGVECAYISGSTQGERHAWNLVKVNGEYYYLDVTWGEQSFTNSAGGSSPYYGLFCCTSEELFRTHTLDGDIPVPVCQAVAANYYAREGLLFDSYDYSQALTVMEDAVSAGRDFTVKYTNTAAYENALRAIIDQGDVSQMFRDTREQLGYGPDSSSILYYHDDTYNILTVFLSSQEGQDDQG